MPIEYLPCVDKPERGTRFSCHFVVGGRRIKIKLTDSAAAGLWREWTDCEAFCGTIGWRTAELIESSGKPFAEGAVFQVRSDMKLSLDGAEGEGATIIADLSDLADR